MKTTETRLRKLIREAFVIPDEVLDMYTSYMKAVQSGDKAEEERVANHFKGVIAVLDQFDDVDGDREEEGTDEFSVQAFRNMIARENEEKNEGKTLKITKRQLRRIIKEEKQKILAERHVRKLVRRKLIEAKGGHDFLDAYYGKPESEEQAREFAKGLSDFAADSRRNDPRAYARMEYRHAPNDMPRVGDKVALRDDWKEVTGPEYDYVMTVKHMKGKKPGLPNGTFTPTAGPALGDYLDVNRYEVVERA